MDDHLQRQQTGACTDLANEPSAIVASGERTQVRLATVTGTHGEATICLTSMGFPHRGPLPFEISFPNPYQQGVSDALAAEETDRIREALKETVRRLGYSVSEIPVR